MQREWGGLERIKIRIHMGFLLKKQVISKGKHCHNSKTFRIRRALEENTHYEPCKSTLSVTNMSMFRKIMRYFECDALILFTVTVFSLQGKTRYKSSCGELIFF